MKRCALPLLRSGSSVEEHCKRANPDDGFVSIHALSEKAADDNAVMGQERVKSKGRKEGIREECG